MGYCVTRLNVKIIIFSRGFLSQFSTASLGWLEVTRRYVHHKTRVQDLLDWSKRYSSLSLKLEDIYRYKNIRLLWLIHETTIYYRPSTPPPPQEHTHTPHHHHYTLPKMVPLTGGGMRLIDPNCFSIVCSKCSFQ